MYVFSNIYQEMDQVTLSYKFCGRQVFSFPEIKFLIIFWPVSPSRKFKGGICCGDHLAISYAELPTLPDYAEDFLIFRENKLIRVHKFDSLPDSGNILSIICNFKNLPDGWIESSWLHDVNVGSSAYGGELLYLQIFS